MIGFDDCDHCGLLVIGEDHKADCPDAEASSSTAPGPSEQAGQSSNVVEPPAKKNKPSAAAASSSGNGADEVPKEYECCVCMQLLRPPVLMTCGTSDLHRVCGECMDSLKNKQLKCPLCRKDLMADPGRAQEAEKQIAKLGHELGCKVCDESVPYAQYAEHTQKCDKVYHCPLDMFKAATLEELDNHMKRCHEMNVFEGPLDGEDPEVTEVTPIFTDATWHKLTSKLDRLIKQGEEQRGLVPRVVRAINEECKKEPLRALCKFDDDRVLVEFFLEVMSRLNVRCTWIRSVKVATPPVKSLTVEFKYSDGAMPITTSHTDVRHIKHCRPNESVTVSFPVPYHFEWGELPPPDEHNVMVYLEDLQDAPPVVDEESEGEEVEVEVDQEVDAYAEEEIEEEGEEH